MAFPFWWMGAAVATLFLAAAFTLFGVALRVIAWTAGEMRDSMLPGVVSGFRGWTGGSRPGREPEQPASPASAFAPGGGPEVEELSTSGVATVRARRR